MSDDIPRLRRTSLAGKSMRNFRIVIAHPVAPGAEIEEILWLDSSTPGALKLAPLTRDRLPPLCSRPAKTMD